MLPNAVHATDVINANPLMMHFRFDSSSNKHQFLSGSHVFPSRITWMYLFWMLGVQTPKYPTVKYNEIKHPLSKKIERVYVVLFVVLEPDVIFKENKYL